MLISSRPWSDFEPDTRLRHAWRLKRGKQTWFAHASDLPELSLVVAHSGQKGKTAQQVARVARFVERSRAGPDVIQDMGRVTVEGIRALRKGDLASAGELMNEYHFLLNLCGVGTRKLDEIAYVARKHALGSKITGAGGGGCIVALTETPEACAGALRPAGVQVYTVQIEHEGVVHGPLDGPI